MAKILSYPFRILPNGAAASVDQGSDEANAEQIGVLALTRIGERALVPTFGVEDPAFGSVTMGDLVAGITMFGPEVRIDDVAIRRRDEHTQEVSIAFS